MSRIWTLGPYDPCPCGSGKKFKFCHRDALKQQGQAVLRQQTTRSDVTTYGGLAWMDAAPLMSRYPHQHQPAIVVYPTKPEYWPQVQQQVQTLADVLPPASFSAGPMPGHHDGQALKVYLTQRQGELWGLYVGFADRIDRLMGAADLGAGEWATVGVSQEREFAQEFEPRLPEDELLYWMHLVRHWGMAVLTIYQRGDVDPRDPEKVSRVYIPAENVFVRWRDDAQPRPIEYEPKGVVYEAVDAGAQAEPVITYGSASWRFQVVDGFDLDDFAVDCEPVGRGPSVSIALTKTGRLFVTGIGGPEIEIENPGDMISDLRRGDAQTVRTVLLGYLGTVRKRGGGTLGV